MSFQWKLFQDRHLAINYILRSNFKSDRLTSQPDYLFSKRKYMKLVNDGCGSECFHWKWRLMIVVLSRLCSCVELSFVYSIWWQACRFGSGGIKAYPSGALCVSRSSHETKIRSILLRRFPALPWLMVWYNLISWHQFATTSSCVCFCADWK